MEPCFIEVVPVVEELTIQLQSNDDCQTVEKILFKTEELKKVFEQKQQELKDIVANKSKQLSKLDEEHAKEEKKLARTRDETMEIVKKQEEVDEEISRLYEKAESMDRTITEIEQELELASKRCETAKASEQVAVPKIKHALSLYANISNIRWDFNTIDRVKGYISVPGDGSVRPFDLDKKDMQDYEIANYLWDLTSTA